MADHIARLPGGSLLTESDILDMGSELAKLHSQLIRARRLAAKLEEVVAMRENVMRALIEWDFNPQRKDAQLSEIVQWAHSQLSEIP